MVWWCKSDAGIRLRKFLTFTPNLMINAWTSGEKNPWTTFLKLWPFLILMRKKNHRWIDRWPEERSCQHTLARQKIYKNLTNFLLKIISTPTGLNRAFSPDCYVLVYRQQARNINNFYTKCYRVNLLPCGCGRFSSLSSTDARHP
jgi:hypothetical protein